MAEKRKISLVLADVDGTLVTEQKVLTKRAQSAVRALRDAGIRFAVTSGRPPLGMSMLFDALELDTPIAGFNGGLFVTRDLAILAQKTVPEDVARQAIRLMREHGLDTCVYSGNDWLITKSGAPHVAREAWTVRFEPKIVAGFDDVLNRVAKIVGVSDDHERVRRCDAARPRCRRTYGIAAAWRACAGGARALGGCCLAWSAGDPHYDDLSRDREQPARRVSGSGAGEGNRSAGDPRRR